MRPLDRDLLFYVGCALLTEQECSTFACFGLTVTQKCTFSIFNLPFAERCPFQVELSTGFLKQLHLFVSLWQISQWSDEQHPT